MKLFMVTALFVKLSEITAISIGFLILRDNNESNNDHTMAFHQPGSIFHNDPKNYEIWMETDYEIEVEGDSDDQVVDLLNEFFSKLIFLE